ncbi:MAG TPA: alternative ribosome rescue aminoacyl-tRNA hydrolase ArfB [Actinomycetales bacterium]|jgi:ribosome-associated protein
MTGELRVTSSVVVPPGELSWRFSRSSGPGGQGVNTTDSRVELIFDVAASTALTEPQRARVLERLGGRLVDGSVTIAASEHRSQLRNRDAAAARLAQLLREALAPPARSRRATRPTKGSQRRRLDEKTRRGQTKQMRRPPGD